MSFYCEILVPVQKIKISFFFNNCIYGYALILYRTLIEFVFFEVSCPTQVIVRSRQWDEIQWFRSTVHITQYEGSLSFYRLN